MKKEFCLFKWLVIPVITFLLVISINACLLNKNPRVSIIMDKTQAKSVMNGLTKLTDALHSKGVTFEEVASLYDARGEIIIVAGLTYGEGVASQLLKVGKQNIPKVPEALMIWKTDWQKKPVWVVSGFDDTGLMYALLDVSNRIGWSTNQKEPLSELLGITEKPDVKERAISIYTMNRAYWESRFYDENYWVKYLDMLAKNRFNSLVIILGYENGGFLAPCYPYFFDTEDFPDVKMTGITPGEQKRNLETLNKLIKMSHERGVKLSLGIWDHIYRGGVQGAGIPGLENALNQPIEGLVWGLNAENLLPYTKSSLAKLIKLVPELDGIQFRMHGESGLKENEQESFWLDIFQQIKKTSPEMKLVLRAKGMPESVIQSAIDVGVNFTIGTKYWMEQMGMPYHPTHINRKNQFDRRHGYADMLRYPQQYKMHWKLWNGGTNRILLWGNPDFAKRFAESTHLYEGEGFEVNEPLATKMHGQPHDEEPFGLLNSPYQYYEYEFERYWHFFQVFGRMGYNPETPPELWQKEFELRFGKEAGPLVEKTIHRASWILPRIVASVYNYDSSFPTTRGWAEKQRLGNLHHYSLGEGSDIQQFASFDEEAQLLLEGGETAKILPSMTSLWFEKTSKEIDDLIAKAEKAIGNNRNKEFNSTITDLKILSKLAIYHSRRIPAAVSYRLFEKTRDISALDSAIEYERKAIEAWAQIVDAAGDVYASDLKMGVRSIDRKNDLSNWTKRLSGHWKDEFALLEEGLLSLDQKRKNFNEEDILNKAPRFKVATSSSNNKVFQITHQEVTNAPVGQPIKVSVKVSAGNGVKSVRLRYRSVNQKEDYQSLRMLPGGEKETYQAVVPAEEINPKWDFMYFIEIMDKNSKGIIYPDLNKETPYVIVKLIR